MSEPEPCKVFSPAPFVCSAFIVTTESSAGRHARAQSDCRVFAVENSFRREILCHAVNVNRFSDTVFNRQRTVSKIEDNIFAVNRVACKVGRHADFVACVVGDCNVAAVIDENVRTAVARERIIAAIANKRVSFTAADDRVRRVCADKFNSRRAFGGVDVRFAVERVFSVEGRRQSIRRPNSSTSYRPAQA